MPATFFEGASNIQISGRPTFQNIEARGNVYQTHHRGNIYNRDSNNAFETVIQDSYNDNSRHIVGAPSHVVEREVESAMRSARTRANGRSDPAAQAVRSEPDLGSTTPLARSSSTESSDADERPAPPAHAVSNPVVPTQAFPAPPTLAVSPPPPTNASPYLAPPVLQSQSTNTSSTSLTPSVATSPGITQDSAGLELHRATSAPAPSTVNGPFGPSLAVPAVQPHSARVGKTDLGARYRSLVTQPETRDEIRRKLVNVAQSVPKDKFFMLKEQAITANSILELIEGSKEKIKSKEEVARLCLESHAVAFVAIMAAETQTPNDKKMYKLLKVLNNVEELMGNVVHKNGLSRMHPFKKSENEKLIKSYRKELEAWLKDLQNDEEATIDFALHKASIALSEALYMEQQYTIAGQEPAAQQTSSAPPAPPSSHPQRPALAPGSTSISNVSEAGVALGSGSVSVINGGGSIKQAAPRNSSTSLAPPNSKPHRPSLSSGSTSVSDVSKAGVALGSGSVAVINAEGPGNHQIVQHSNNDNSIKIYGR